MEELKGPTEYMLAISRIYEKVISSMHMGDILLDCFNFNSSNMVATFVKEEGFENFVKFGSFLYFSKKKLLPLVTKFYK